MASGIEKIIISIAVNHIRTLAYRKGFAVLVFPFPTFCRRNQFDRIPIGERDFSVFHFDTDTVYNITDPGVCALKVEDVFFAYRIAEQEGPCGAVA